MVGAFINHCLAASRAKVSDAANRKADALAFLYKWFATVAAVPLDSRAPPAKPDAAFREGLPDFRAHVAKIKGDLERNAAFEKAVLECVWTDNLRQQPTADLRGALLAKIQAVADALE